MSRENCAPRFPIPLCVNGVTEFIETLKAELEGKSREFRIWWDPRLRTVEDFNLAIADALSESAEFLSVLSLAYGESTYCKLEEFRRQRHPAFGMTVGSMSRMQAIVIEREFTRQRWAPEFRTTSPCNPLSPQIKGIHSRIRRLPFPATPVSKGVSQFRASPICGFRFQDREYYASVPWLLQPPGRLGYVAGTFDGRTFPAYSFDAITVQLQ